MAVKEGGCVFADKIGYLRNLDSPGAIAYLVYSGPVYQRNTQEAGGWTGGGGGRKGGKKSLLNCSSCYRLWIIRYMGQQQCGHSEWRFASLCRVSLPGRSVRRLDLHIPRSTQIEPL